MVTSKQLDLILRHSWSEPKFVAQVQFWNEYPSPMRQMLAGVPRWELESYIETGRHPNPDRVLSYVEQEPEPDFDWWEPRHDQLWRRPQARERELDRKLRAS